MSRKKISPRKTPKTIPRENTPIQELFDKYNDLTNFWLITLNFHGVEVIESIASLIRKSIARNASDGK